MLHTVTLEDVPCCLAISPNALVVGVAMSTNIAFYSAKSGVLLDCLNGIHNGKWSGYEANGPGMRL